MKKKVGIPLYCVIIADSHNMNFRTLPSLRLFIARRKKGKGKKNLRDE